MKCSTVKASILPPACVGRLPTNHHLIAFVRRVAPCGLAERTDLGLDGAGVQLVGVLPALLLQQLRPRRVLLQRSLEADDLAQLVADVCLAVPQLLLQQRDLARLLAHLRLDGGNHEDGGINARRA